jgi:hypothetical protein
MRLHRVSANTQRDSVTVHNSAVQTQRTILNAPNSVVRVRNNLVDRQSAVSKSVTKAPAKGQASTARSQSVTLAPYTGKPKITVKLTITRTNLLYVPVGIGDGYLDTLIDTGASYTFMDMSMLQLISEKDPQFGTTQWKESEVGAVECSNGSHQEILGQFGTQLQTGSVRFDAIIQVAKDQPVPFILKAMH